MLKKITIVCPVYNETDNIPVLTCAISRVMSTLQYDYSILLVDDGSKDGTLQTIKKVASESDKINFISLSRNFGHQNALKAGFDHSNADAVITMDGDMQHPPELLPTLIQLWEKGNDIVYTIRKDHLELPAVKRTTSNLFYNVLNSLSDIELESGTADFRLMDKKVVAVARELKENDLFWRGMIKWFGFRQIAVEYEAAMRLKGKSKYTVKKMIELALKGITSFSTKPLTFAIYLGFISAVLSILYIPYALLSESTGHAVSGWTSVILTIAFFAGVQLMILGIIGMYLGKLFMQNKQRPHYIIKDKNF